MTEKVYKFSDNTQKVIEPVIKDENLHYMHMVLPNGEGLPVHTTNANVYMTEPLKYQYNPVSCS